MWSCARTAPFSSIHQSINPPSVDLCHRAGSARRFPLGGNCFSALVAVALLLVWQPASGKPEVQYLHISIYAAAEKLTTTAGRAGTG